MMVRLPFVEPEDVADAVQTCWDVVKDGGVLLLPTESFYGLGVDPMDSGAVRRIYSMKDRPSELGLPVLCADWQQVESLVVVPDHFRVKLGRFWPAALTVVLPAIGDIPAARGDSLAVRIPAYAELRALLYGVGPLTGTSANRHGTPPFTTVDGALASLVDAPDITLDAGATAGGEVSTLIDLRWSEPEILRRGKCVWDEPYPDSC
ncbi:MAG: threonylcarbamoyl-AMP synthase [Acidobacteria bacterium]|jgi:L-threonylcarbamoyladenylate synthase|nr:threonylcarbamoyl-AMP synthase [Acidobacteriota bacterium]